MRAWTEYADRQYLTIDGPAHIVPWDEIKRALCGATTEEDTDWYGTGDWDEIEVAARLPLCRDCLDAAGVAHFDGEDPAVADWRQALAAKH